MVMVFILERKYFYIKSFREKPTGIIILYGILTVTYYGIYVNYRILTVTGLYRYKKTCNFPAILHPFLFITTNDTGRFVPR